MDSSNLTVLYPAPIGMLQLEVNEQGALTRIQWQPPVRLIPKTLPMWHSDQHSFSAGSSVSDVLKKLCEQLDAYFFFFLTPFTLPIAYEGSVFERVVWKALTLIPYGTVRTYKQIALQCGYPQGVRAVGQALHRNPLLIVIPCHRVIASDGRLGGFACGVAVKQFLLRLEGVTLF